MGISNHESKFYFLLYLIYISRKLRETKNGEPVKNNQFSALVTPARFEPATVTFVVWYSIQLSYGAIVSLCGCKYIKAFCFYVTFKGYLIRFFDIIYKPQKVNILANNERLLFFSFKGFSQNSYFTFFIFKQSVYVFFMCK